MGTYADDALKALQEIKTGNQRQDSAIAFAIAAVRMNQWLMEERRSMSSTPPFSASMYSIVPFEDEFLEFSKSQILDAVVNEIRDKAVFATYKDDRGYILRMSMRSEPDIRIPIIKSVFDKGNPEWLRQVKECESIGD